MPLRHIIPALEELQRIREVGTDDHIHWAEGQVLDALKKTPMEGWAAICEALAKAVKPAPCQQALMVELLREASPHVWGNRKNPHAKELHARIYEVIKDK